MNLQIKLITMLTRRWSLKLKIQTRCWKNMKLNPYDSQSIAARRQKREIKKLAMYANYLSVVSSNPIANTLVIAESIYYDEPRSYKEAVKCKEAVE